MLPKTDPRQQAADLLRPCVSDGVMLEPVTWKGTLDGRLLVRATRKCDARFPNGGCVFLEVDRVLEDFDFLGEAAELHYEMWFLKHRM